MRRAVLSDIHSNLEALDAVLVDAREQQVTEIYCLGDIIGHGPDPIACIDLAMTFDVTLKGKYEEIMFYDPFGYSPVSLQAARWTRLQIKESRDEPIKQRLTWLGALPEFRRELDMLFVYGSPRDASDEHIRDKAMYPLSTFHEYIYPEDVYNQRKMNALFTLIERYCFHGYTHIPGIFTEDHQFLSPEECNYVYRLPSSKMMFNVGSVGQPRDGDPRACYAILTDETVIFRRVEYPIDITAAKIRNIPPLDDSSGDRLGNGR